MRFTHAALLPGKPESERAAQAALLLAILLIIMAVGQLYEFEKFIPLIESFETSVGHGGATLLAGVIVTSEVFALPFLLRMQTSPLMRVTSMLLGWLVVAIWIALTLWLSVAANSVTNIGLFGTKVDIPASWWAVCYSIALGVLATWAAWGMWPFRTAKHKTVK
ncbi:hypothetical protein EON76_03205 [bacterium]|nr:MAG: hypothetical protein EON76_03205 [bacterium]